MVKPHGLQGEVVVELVTNRAERTVPGARFATDQGNLEVVAARPFQGRWLMTFRAVGTRQDAEALRGVVLRAPALDDPGALWVHEVVGAAVVDQGTGMAMGRVVAVVANPASDLLELDTGRLVPMRFVVRSDSETVVVDAPAGLWD